MDALAHYRRAQGLPGLSINWGPWDKIGMAAGLKGQDRSRMADRGITPIDPEHGLKVVDLLLSTHSAQVTVMPVKWSRLLQSYSEDQEPPIFEEMIRQIKSRKPVKAIDRGKAELRRRLEAAPESERRDMLISFVSSQVTKVMGLDPSHPLNLQTPFRDLGLDSLMAVELRNALAAAIGRSLQTSLVYDYPTIEKLAEYLRQELIGDVMPENHHRRAAKNEIQLEEISEKLNDLDQVEVAKMLAEQLASLKEANSE
jgi:acyl carrier protein